MALIRCENLSYTYENRTVLDNLTLEIEQGDYLCIVGENGAGKSTLIKGLLGLKSPRSGRVVLGEGLSRRDIGYLPQQTEVQQNFPASVSEVVLSGCLGKCGLRPFFSKRDRMAARKAMHQLGICDLQNQCYKELSGGQQQRVLLARALCAASRLLVLDEPVSSLEPRAATDMYALIKEQNRESGLTVIMVSHDVKAALGEATKILHLCHEVLFFGTCKAYAESDLGRTFTAGGEG